MYGQPQTSPGLRTRTPQVLRSNHPATCWDSNVTTYFRSLQTILRVTVLHEGILAQGQFAGDPTTKSSLSLKSLLLASCSPRPCQVPSVFLTLEVTLLMLIPGRCNISASSSSPLRSQSPICLFTEIMNTDVCWKGFFSLPQAEPL